MHCGTRRRIRWYRSQSHARLTPAPAKGMGLFVVGRLVRRHDATVRLRTTDALHGQPGVTASVYLPGALIAPPSEIVDPLDDPLTRSYDDAPLVSIGPRRVPDREFASNPDVGASLRADEVTPVVSAHNGSALPKRSPGASGVNAVQTDPAPAAAED